jgi:predicted dehydrogenase
LGGDEDLGPNVQKSVRNDDKDHESYPSLPTLSDGLRTEEVIDAARRSNSTRRWATVGR